MKGAIGAWVCASWEIPLVPLAQGFRELRVCSLASPAYRAQIQLVCPRGNSDSVTRTESPGKLRPVATDT